MIRTILVVVMFLLTALFPTYTSAQVLNPSFENTTGLTVNNWTQSGNVGFLTSAFGKTPPLGNKMAYMVSQNTAVPGITSTSQVSAATLATALGTTIANLNTATGAGSSVTTGAGATGGSGISQTFTAPAGFTLSFLWDFLTTEDPIAGPTTVQNDMGFVSINGVITVLGRLDGTNSTHSAYQYIPSTIGGGSVNGSAAASYLFETGSGNGTATQRSTDYGNDSINNAALGFGFNKFQQFQITFPTTTVVNLGFGVLNVESGALTPGTPSALIVDDIGLALVPEPGTLVLLTLGITCAVTVLHRRTREMPKGNL
jgi:hypothetical protein